LRVKEYNKLYLKDHLDKLLMGKGKLIFTNDD